MALASFRCGAKVERLLEVKRTCRDRGRGFDLRKRRNEIVL
jgi:hypothetical protein